MQVSKLTRFVDTMTYVDSYHAGMRGPFRSKYQELQVDTNDCNQTEMDYHSKDQHVHLS